MSTKSLAVFFCLICMLSRGAWADVADMEGIRGAYEAARHGFQAVESGWEARNPGQQWVSAFDKRGFQVQPQGGGWSWGLELRSYGFEGGPRTVSGVPGVRAEGQRLSYEWDESVQEWFVNDERGLEHGFTVRERPGRAEGRLSFTLSTRGDLMPRVSGQGVAFVNEAGATVLNYSGLKVWDADGKVLESCFEALEGKSFRVLVDEREARYPITIDPVAQQAYLKASNTGASDNFGYSVAVSGDTAVVGAYQEDSNATGVNGNQADNSASNSGAVYVFTRTAGVWSQQAYLKASNTGAGDNFGYSVAIAGDTLVVGAYLEDSNATGVNGNEADNSSANSGAVYVFTRTAGVWSQQAYLKASNTGAGDNFGEFLTVAGDTLVVGAISEDSNATGVDGNQANNSSTNSGAAYVFTRTAGVWSQQAYLKASNTGASDQFGYSVALAGDTVVVGAIGEASNATGVNGNEADNSSSFSGAAYVFTRTAGVWSQQAYLKASNTGASDQFGFSVALSGDTALIGAYGEASHATGVNGNEADNSSSASGAAYVFTRSAGAWSQQAYLKASNTGASDQFGYSVALSGDTVIVGAKGEDSHATGVNGNEADNSSSASGAAYVFTRSAGVWSQQAYLKASNSQANDDFGRVVAVSGDTAIVSAMGEDSNATGVNGNEADNSSSGSGAAYAFLITPNALPAISAPSSIVGAIKATLGAEVTDNGGGGVERGIVYALTSVNADPLIAGTGVTKVAVSGSTGVFTTLITGLSQSTGYSFKGYVTNSAGTVYTSVSSFTTQVNAAATDITAATAFSIAENNAAAATVTSLVAVDANLLDVHTFSLVAGTGDADNASFTIVGSALKITPVADYEVKSSYSIRLRATDEVGAQFEKALTISVLNVTEPTVTASTASITRATGSLTITGSDFSTTAAENVVTFTPTGSGTVTASTSTSLTVTGITGLSLGALNAVVTHNGYTSGAPVQVATVVNAAPSDVIPLETMASVFNNDPAQVSTAGTFHAAVCLGSSDLVVNGVTFSRYLSSIYFANGSLINMTDPTLGSVATGGSGSYGALVSSGGYREYGGNIVINGLTPGQVYQAQFFMPYWDSLHPTGFSLSGGGSFVLRCGVGGGAPEIRTSTFVATAPTMVFSGSSQSLSNIFIVAAVSVRQINAPTVFSIAENNAPGAHVGALAAVDIDPGQTHSFSLVSGAGSTDNASLTIVGGALYITPVADYETKSSYSIRVQADDGAGGLLAKILTINVLDVANEPTVTTSTANLSLAASLTINGTNFSTTPGQNVVSFSPAGSGIVTASTATSLTVTGITGLSLGPLSAIVTVNGKASGAPVQVATVVNTPPTDISVIPPSIPTVAWGPTSLFSDSPAQVSTSGTHHAAVCFGGSDLTVNGVTFSRHTGSGSFANGSLISTSTATHASTATGGSGSGSYGALVSSGGFQDTGGSILVSGLTAGQVYQVQLFMPYWDTLRPTAFGSAGGSAVNLQCGLAGGAAPDVITGTFLATGATHAISWNALAPNTYALLAAVSVRQITSTPNSLFIAEQNIPGADIGTLAATDPDPGQTYTFSLVSGAGSTDNASFTIVGNTLKITPVADYETKSSYSIRVQVTDSEGGSFAKVFTISVLDVVETTVTMSTANLFNTASLTINGTHFSTTPGQNVVTFSPSGSGTVTASTATSLTVTGITGLSFGPLSAIVNVNSRSSGAPVQVATVVNAVPTDVLPRSVFWGTPTSFNDNETQISTTGTFHSAVCFRSNPLVVNGVPFSWHDANGTFYDDNLAVSPISTTAATHSSSVSGGSGNYGALVSSGGFQNTGGSITLSGLTAGQMYQVQLFMPYAESLRPTAFGSTGGSTVVLQCGLFGNPPPDVITGTFVATGATQSISWNAHAPNTFALLSAVSLRQITSTATLFSIAENNAPGADVTSLSAVDLDPGQTHSFSLVAGAGDTDNASFTIVGNVLKLTPVADYETKSSYSIRVQVSDGAGGTFAKAFTIPVLDVVETPVVTASTASIPLNATSLTINGANFSSTPAQNTGVFTPAIGGTVTASTSTSLTITGISGLTAGPLSVVVTTNSISSGAAVQVATVSSNSNPTGITTPGTAGVNWASAANFNNTPTQVSTTGTHHAAVRFGSSDLTVNGVTFSRHLGSGSFANGSLISTVSATNNSVASGGSGDYGTLVSNGGFQSTGGNITISGLTVGRLYQVQLFMPFWDTLRPTNFSSTGGSSVTLQCGFTGNPNPDIRIGTFRATSTSQAISWAAQAPNTFALLAAVSVRLLDHDFTLTENNAPNATVGTFAAVDPDAGQTHTFSLVSGTGDTDNASFTIVGNELKLTPSADYETKSAYSLRVQADDGAGGTFARAFTLIILDMLVEPPQVTTSTANITRATTSLTITGADFSTTPAQNTVTFTPTGSGTVTASTATSLTVTGLSGLSLGALNVVVTSNGQNSVAPVQVATVVNSAPTDIAPGIASSTVVWDSVTKFNNTPAQVSTAGTQHAAVRFGSSDLVVNGVTFSGYLGSGAFAGGGIAVPAASSQGSFGSGGSGSYGTLVSSGGFLNASGTITLSGLTAGDLYQIQAFMPFWDTLRPTLFGSTGGSSVVLQCGFTGNPNPDIRTGLFRPTATTHVINWAPQAPNTFALLSAISVRRLPDLQITENNAPDATVGTLSTADVDTDQTHTYTLVSGAGDTDNASFTLVGNVLKLTPVADYETKSTYTLRVQTSDGAGGTYSRALTVTILNVVEPIDTWRQTYFGSTANTGTSADNADADADGLPNLIEYAFSLNPTDGASLQLPQPQISGSDFTTTFIGVSGVTYAAQWSTTLLSNSWTPITDTGTGNTHTFTVPIGTNERIFLRYIVTRP